MSLSRPCRPPSAALIPHATHRGRRAFSLSPVPPQHPRPHDSGAIYEKTILRTSTRTDLSLFFVRAVSGVQRLCRSGMRAGGRRVERMVSFRREVVAFAERRRPNFVRCGRCCADRLTAAGNRCILLLSLAAVTFERCGRFNDLAGIRIRVLSGIIQHCATVLQHRRSCLRALRGIRRLVASSAAETKKIMEKTLCVKK